jgi:hypothetical protein
MALTLFVTYWDVVDHKEKEYEQFILKSYLPTCKKIGLRMLGGYYVVVGAGPRIVGISTAENPSRFQEALISEEYSIMTEKMSPLIKNFSTKLLVSYGPIEPKRYEIQFGIWKLNHLYNILPGMEEAFKNFMRDEFIPKIEKLGTAVSNIWKTVVGSGPFILVESSASGMERISQVIDSDEYRTLTRTLKTQYVTDYQSKILAPTGRVELPYFMKA